MQAQLNAIGLVRPMQNPIPRDTSNLDCLCSAEPKSDGEILDGKPAGHQAAENNSG
jgi:hypothetical protein